MNDERLLTPAAVLDCELSHEIPHEKREGLGAGVALRERHVRLSEVVDREGETDSGSPRLLWNGIWLVKPLPLHLAEVVLVEPRFIYIDQARLLH
jgi:hypothetical protein